jgi:polar amino acid transport system substrate-binding protein
MMKNACKFTFLIIFLSLFWRFSSAEDLSLIALPKFNIYTEDWVPFQFYSEKSELDGLAVELLELIFKELGSEQNRNNMQIIPWARAIKLLDKENTIVFSMTVTDERLPKYQWIGPIYNINSYVYVKADSKLSERDFGQGNTLTTSIILEDVNFQYMATLHIDKERISSVSSSESPLKMLSIGRVDFIIDNPLNFKEVAMRTGLHVEDYKRLFVMDNASISYAVSQNTSANYVEVMQYTLTSIKASPSYTALLKKYDL